jgi:putative ABC transport system permease protein
MSAIRLWGSRLAGFLRRGRPDELATELQFHREMLEQQLRDSGMAAPDARREAARRLGGTTQITEAYHDQRSLPFAETLLQDLRYGLRALRRAPAFTAAALLTLSLGLGVNTAIFSIVDAVVIRPLPFEDPDALIWLRETNEKRRISQFSASYANYLDWRARSRSWEALAAVGTQSVNVLTGRDPERVPAQFMTSNLLPMLRLRVAIGRGFLPEEDDPGRSAVVILSDRFWRRNFQSDPRVLGRALVVNGTPHTVIGVAPPNFGMAGETELFLPLGPYAQMERSRHELDVIGRLNPGVSREQAAAEIATLAPQMERENPEENAGWSVGLTPLADVVVDGDTRANLALLLGAAGLVLLIACANLCSLLIVRGSVRTREFAIRAALGGGRWRLVRQLVTESVLLSMIGAGTGVLLAQWCLSVFHALDPAALPRADEIRIDGGVWLFACAAAIATGIAAALLPALQASRVDVLRGLRANAQGPLRGQRRVRNALIVAQLAVSIVLLAASGLMLRTLQQLYGTDLGFNPANLVTVRVEPTANQIEFLTTLRERIIALPGVQAIGATSGAPMTTFNTSLNVFPAGPALIPRTDSIQSHWRIVTGEFFETMGIRVVKGRTFRPGDDGRAQKVVIVNETLARMLWGAEDPIGRRISPGGGDDYSTVIGVAGDIRSHNPALAPLPSYYMSAYSGIWGPMTLVIRSTADVGGLAAAIRREVKALDPTLPLFDVRTMRDLVTERIRPQRTVTALLTAFAVVAVALAAVGIYGVMAYATEQRRREVGVRMALGARNLDVLSALLREGAGLIAAGIAAGVALALAATRLMTGLLTDVRPGDPLTLAMAVLVLASVSLLACYLPVRRALKIHPVAVLRSE